MQHIKQLWRRSHSYQEAQRILQQRDSNQSAITDLLNPQPTQKPRSELETVEQGIAKWKLTVFRVLTWVDLRFGFRFFILKLDGIQLEILSYVVINLIHWRFEQHMLVGGSISILILVYYLLVLFSTYKFAKLCWTVLQASKAEQASRKPDKQKNPEASKNSKSSKSSKAVPEYQNNFQYQLSEIGSQKLGSLAVLYSDYKKPRVYYELYFPLLYFGRSVTIVLAALCLVSYPKVQVSLVLVIESVYLYLIARSSVKASKADNIQTVGGRQGHGFDPLGRHFRELHLRDLLSGDYGQRSRAVYMLQEEEEAARTGLPRRRGQAVAGRCPESHPDEHGHDRAAGRRLAGRNRPDAEQVLLHRQESEGVEQPAGPARGFSLLLGQDPERLASSPPEEQSRSRIKVRAQTHRLEAAFEARRSPRPAAANDRPLQIAAKQQRPLRLVASLHHR